MKKIILYGFLFLAVLSFGQKNKTSAEKNFDALWYKKAAKQFQTRVEKGDDSKEALQRVGDAFYFNTDMESAVKWYGLLFASYEHVLQPTYIFRYIHALKGVGNYGMANLLINRYGEVLEKANYAISDTDGNANTLDDLLRLAPQFLLSNLSINTKFADFGSAYYNNQIVFASSRDTMNLHTRVYQWNEQPYLNLFVADTTADGADLKNAVPFTENINTKYHEAVAAFSPDGKSMYFTRNNYTNKDLKRDSSGTNHLKLYRSDLIDNVWGEAVELPFNDVAYSVGQPALSPDGKQLYFVSDMPGTMGSTDIFVVDILDNNTYGNPKNLGPVINTSGREMFPYKTEGKLYFSSDGHLGYGGLDVFESSYTDGFAKPNNLGKPLNSNLDDFAYIVDEASQRGYVSSNRKGGKGDDDIYAFIRLERKCGQTIRGTVVRKANAIPIPDVTVALILEENILATSKTDANGAFTFDETLDCESSYKLRITKTGFNSSSEIFSTTDEPDFVNTVPLEMEKELNRLIVKENGVLKIKIENIYFDLNKADIRPDAAQELNKIVEVMKEYPKMIIKIESHTDSRGSDQYNERLSDRRAKATGNYISSQGIEAARIESAIGYGEKQLINECANGVKCENQRHDVNRRSEFIIVKLD